MANYVLIPPSWMSGWCWQKVAAELREAGHHVLTPTLAGTAERAHELRPGLDASVQGAEIAELLFFEDLRDVVLVGTSTGGLVVTAAAERARERIRHLVFVDALVLLDGEKVGDVITRSERVATGLASAPTRDYLETKLLTHMDDDTKRWAAARCRPHPTAVGDTPMRLPTFWSQPWDATVIRCTESSNPPEAHQRRTADRLKGRYLEMRTGHYPFLGEPRELARLLLAV